jgi:hypothetical protein
MDTQVLKLWSRNSIPVPKLNKRETEHLNTCLCCQATWPLFYADGIGEHSLDELCISWQDMTEAQRFGQAQASKRKFERRARLLAKKRDPTAYVMFLKQRKFSKEEVQSLPFKERNRIVNEEWHALSREKKESLQTQAHEFKRRRLENEKNAPRFERRLLALSKRELKQSKAQARNRMVYKPRNAFFILLQDMQTEETLKPEEQRLAYKDLISRTAATWRQMQPEARQPYLTRSVQLNALYHKEKQRLLKGVERSCSDDSETCPPPSL